MVAKKWEGNHKHFVATFWYKLSTSIHFFSFKVLLEAKGYKHQNVMAEILAKRLHSALLPLVLFQIQTATLGVNLEGEIGAGIQNLLEGNTSTETFLL